MNPLKNKMAETVAQIVSKFLPDNKKATVAIYELTQLNVNIKQWELRAIADRAMFLHKESKPMNIIDVDKNSNSTVYGEYAHRLWNYGKGDYPRQKSRENSYYVMKLNEMPYGERWEVVASQTTKEGAIKYMTTQDLVLISIEDNNK